MIKEISKCEERVFACPYCHGSGSVRGWSPNPKGSIAYTTSKHGCSQCDGAGKLKSIVEIERFSEVLLGITNLLRNISPLHIICDYNDIRTVEQSKSPFFESPTIFIYDIYNPEGIYINRVEFEGVPVKFHGESVYCLNEKGSGYIELVVYKMIWK